MIGGGTGPASGTNATLALLALGIFTGCYKAAEAFPVNLGFFRR